MALFCIFFSIEIFLVFILSQNEQIQDFPSVLVLCLLDLIDQCLLMNLLKFPLKLYYGSVLRKLFVIHMGKCL